MGRITPFNHILADLIQLCLGAVLGGQNHRIHPDRLVVLIVLHRHLGFAVGTEVIHLPLLADLGEALGHFMGQGNGQGHALRGLVTGVAKHHALIPRAVVQLAVALGLGLQRLVHPQGDVGTLLVDVGDDAAGVTVKAILGPVIADLPDHLPGNLRNVHIAAGADLPHNVDETRGRRGLTGHPAVGSWARMASSTASEIWSQILSGCPSVTDSDVKNLWLIGKESSFI